MYFTLGLKQMYHIEWVFPFEKVQTGIFIYPYFVGDAKNQIMPLYAYVRIMPLLLYCWQGRDQG